MVSQTQNSEKCLRKQTKLPSMVSTRFTKRLRFRRTLHATYSVVLLTGIAFLACIGITLEAHSATYYIAPNGTNSNFTGSFDKPWQTFAFAIPKLQPGDTLILKDGTYEGWNSGWPAINCSSGAKNGTSAYPITIKAQNERKAFINGQGQWGVFRILNCSHWKIEGLRAKSRDNPGSPKEDVFYIYNSSNLTFKRLLVTHNNRYGNTHLLSVQFSNNILVEESEFYHFHRHGILNWFSNNNTYRRNYFNSRKMTDISGGFRSTATDRGDIGISNYPGSNNIVENNISENNQAVTDVQALEAAVGNKILGNISLNEHYGVILGARGTGNKMPMNTIIGDMVVINPNNFGIFARGSKNTQLKNVSILGGSSGIVADYETGSPGDGFYSLFSKNTLVNNISTYGFYMKNQKDFSHKFPGSHKPKVNFWPNYNYFNEQTSDQKLGTCKVFIPQTSPLKGKGEGGADIGANVLYRYEKGVLTNTPLWNVTTGAFPIGATIAGVNNVAGSSAFDVHKRLNVNTNGCTLPF